MSATNYLEEQIGTHLFRTGSWTKPSALYIALYTTMPEEDGTGGTEVTGSGYARVQRDPSNSNWDAPSSGDGVYKNSAAIQFGSPAASWGEIAGYGILDNSSGGNLLITCTFDSTVTVNSGDPAPAFAIGQLKVTIG